MKTIKTNKTKGVDILRVKRGWHKDLVLPPSIELEDVRDGVSDAMQRRADSFWWQTAIVQ